MTTWKCTSCGAIDSRICNGDNACCSECGDPEGLQEVRYGIGIVEYGSDPSLNDTVEISIRDIIEIGNRCWWASKKFWEDHPDGEYEARTIKSIIEQYFAEKDIYGEEE